MRLFVGLGLTDEASRGVEKIYKQLRRKNWKVRWVEKENWHVTVVFVGEVGEDKRLIIEEGMEAMKGEVKPFGLKFKGLAGFENKNKIYRYKERIHGRSMKYLKIRQVGMMEAPRVVYVSLRGDLQAFYALVKRVRRELVMRGIRVEEGAIIPHITLGRVNWQVSAREGKQMAVEIDKMKEMEIKQEWWVDKMILYESTTSEGKREYRILNEYYLGG